MLRGNGAAAAHAFDPIAIVGMRGRFPGANDLERFWNNLTEGVESITTLSAEQVRASGIPDEVARLPGYVRAAPLLDRVDEFDAEFFGFSARDASLTDPQHRLFLETAWEALEEAGYDPAAFPGAIGVFGGCEQSTYLYQLYQNRDSLGYLDGMQLMVTNDKDHLCTQVSYRLNLRGPSVVVQTTCSTSLVAVSLACESLHAGRCDMALAGGVTVRVPQRGGYLYTPGSILSPDGHCRPFDAEAQGTIVGSGVGIVVLKRLDRALHDRDTVRAVILGVGINNDGSDKAGYTAPGFRGQVEAVRAAQAVARIAPDTIGYVEAHGTGTILGDPIELSALTEAFRDHTERRGFCGIGSVKSNFGHLSCAAGVAGLIKAVLVVEHGAIPPTVHYRAPNPAIDFAASPFYVTTRTQRWERNGTPRRAAVSSFGVGGTNAHVVIEERPAAAVARRSHCCQLLTLSARTAVALDQTAEQLARHLTAHQELDLADVAYTLHVGRRAFSYRRSVVVRNDDPSGAVALLASQVHVEPVGTGGPTPVVFMFPGQGAQYPGMAVGLYRSEPVVRRAIDHCAEVLTEYLGADLRRLLFAPARRQRAAAEELRNTQWAQPALFTVCYALAELWRSWGVTPAAMIGHSVGEYVAAALAGVMALDDALRLIARRGQLIASLPPGSMLSVMAEAQRLKPFVSEHVSIAALNAPGFTVLSGPHEAIARVETALAAEKIVARRLHTSHAFHSAMMDPILEQFEQAVAAARLAVPSVPFVSTLNGRWADAAVTRPGYWAAQLRSTVRFADAMGSVRSAAGPLGKHAFFLEVGPGRALSTFVSHSCNGSERPMTQVSLPGPEDRRADTEVMLSALGELWARGVAVDWTGFHANKTRRRVPLPTYPFERRSYWIGPRPEAELHEPEARDTSKWFYRPTWQPSPLTGSDFSCLAARRILVLGGDEGVAAGLANRLRAVGGHPLLVHRGARYASGTTDEFVIDPTKPEHFSRLATEVCKAENRLAGVIDLWNAGPPCATDLDTACVNALLAPMRLAHALTGQMTVRPLPVILVARGTARVRDDDAIDPLRAMGRGVARVIPQEHPGLRLAHVDVDDDQAVATQLLAELAAGALEPAVVLRAGERWVESFKSEEISAIEPPHSLPERPVVLMTGGLGHIGINLAEGLFERSGAQLALLARSSLPEPELWSSACKDPEVPADTRAVLQRLARMRATRDDVMVLGADLNDRAQVVRAVEAAWARFGRVDLIVHGAGRIDAAAFASAADTGPSVVQAQCWPKLSGLFHLMEAMRGREPQRWILHSSISTALGGLGLAAYSGVNAALDALALAGGAHWLSIDWDAWDNAAEAGSAGMPTPVRPPEGRDAFLRLVGAQLGSRVVIAVNDLAERLRTWVQRGPPGAAGNGTAVARHPRPNLSTAFEEPRTETERALTEIWSAQLGVSPVGIHDRFLDLGGHSLLAVQVATQIRDEFQIEMPVLRLFQAPTVAQLAVFIDQARTGEGTSAPTALPSAEPVRPEAAPLETDSPGGATKASFRAFYDDISKRLDQTGVGDSSFFLNYGYIASGDADEARFQVPAGMLNPNSIRLAFELIGPVDLKGLRVLDVGCGRGGTVALLAEQFEAESAGVDLSPEAVAFCRRTHRGPRTHFEVGDAEHLPAKDETFDAVINIESSHTYPNLRAFFVEARRVLRPSGWFLYTDLLPVQRWAEVRVLLTSLRFGIVSERTITSNVLASCDEVASRRAKAFGASEAMIDNFLAVPGSAVYEQMHSGAWEYRILRSRRA